MTLNDNLGPDGDALYAELIATHDGLDLDASHALNARLVLMLMNEVGDAERIRTILKAARDLSD
ncbi:MAG: DUF2783 domain-containing protein [Pseudomonadota bacterium]